MRAKLSLLLCLVLWCCAPVFGRSPAGGQVLFHDDFDGSSDPTAWALGKGTIGQTILDQSPTIANGLATLHLDTYDAAAPGVMFSGTELYTTQAFPLGDGLQMEARVRTNAVPDGVITSFFADNFRSDGNDEIDFEALSKQYHQLPASGSSLLLTTWHDWGAPGSAYFDQVHHADYIATIPGFDPTQFNTLTIQYYPDLTRWLVNGQVIWQTTAAHSVGPMHLHFNFWASPPGWDAAYSPNLIAASDPSQDQSYTYDIDWVTATALPPPIPGDVNRDGVVNLADLLTLAQHFNTTGTTWVTGDLNGDGRTDFADLEILAQQLAVPPNGGTAAPSAVSVPEPAALGAAVVLPLIIRRKRFKLT